MRVLLKTFSTVFNQFHSFVTTICNCRFKKCQVSVTNQTTKTSNVYLLASFANALLIRFTSPSPSRKPRKECVTNQKNVCAIDHICTTDFILVTRHQRKLNKQAHFFFFFTCKKSSRRFVIFFLQGRVARRRLESRRKELFPFPCLQSIFESALQWSALGFHLQGKGKVSKKHLSLIKNR